MLYDLLFGPLCDNFCTFVQETALFVVLLKLAGGNFTGGQHGEQDILLGGGNCPLKPPCSYATVFRSLGCGRGPDVGGLRRLYEASTATLSSELVFGVGINSITRNAFECLHSQIVHLARKAVLGAVSMIDFRFPLGIPREARHFLSVVV